ncbi:MAG TPA: GyrI-like domain-containing protein [Mucilaginibacter sp.]|jgi:predicted transcriptional regulator YdeE|nr:GyrI-like domain-containing protein [Mucilaginibacter sp.]
MIAHTEIIEYPQFNVVGISVRTINQNGRSQKDIGELWTRFTTADLIHQIDDRVTDDIYCIYTDYESDHTGYYTAVLGCKVNALTRIGEGFTGISVPKGKYEVYTLSGKFPDNVGDAWRHIWNSGADRTYSADFDLYSAGSNSFEETAAKIYLAIN